MRDSRHVSPAPDGKEKLPDNLKKDISRILFDLIKTIKIVSVYPDNNPLPAKLKESFSERFIDLIRETGGLSFNIGKGEIQYQGEIVFKDGEADESLAQLFFDAGITVISFSNNFGVEELNQFFKVMKAFVNHEKGASDLVSLFWQTNIPGFDYCTLEDLVLREYSGEMVVQVSMESDDSFIRRKSGGSDDSGKVVYSSIFLDDDKGPEHKNTAGSGSAVLTASQGGEASVYIDEVAEKRMGYNPTPPKTKATVADTALILNEAFAMGEADQERVEGILRHDSEFEIYSVSIELLREILNQESEFSDFSETVATLERLQTEFLKTGNIDQAGELLHLLKEFQAQTAKDHPQWSERIVNALAMAGSRQNLDYLKLALNNDQKISRDKINNYLSIFGWEALSAITDLLGELEHRHHREALCAYLSGTGHEHIDIIARGIYDRRWFVVRSTAAILSVIGSDKAFSYLEKAIGHEDPRVRLQIVKGLVSNRSRRGLDLLARMVWDKDEVVGQMAIDALLEFEGDDHLVIIAEIINNDKFPSLNFSNQERLLILFSQRGGEQAVSYLTSMISKWGITKSQLQDFYQQVAFKALGANRSEKAEKELLKYNHSWSKKIRAMANEALAARRQIIYGGK